MWSKCDEWRCTREQGIRTSAGTHIATVCEAEARTEEMKRCHSVASKAGLFRSVLQFAVYLFSFAARDLSPNLVSLFYSPRLTEAKTRFRN